MPGVSGRLSNINHVNIRDVIELSRSGLAHRDNGKPHRSRLRHAGTSTVEGTFKDGIGEVAQFRGDVVNQGDGIVTGKIPGSNLHQSSVIGAPEPVRIGLPCLIDYP